MSGQIVVLPVGVAVSVGGAAVVVAAAAVVVGAVVVAGAGYAAVGAARAVQSLVDQRVEAARREMEAEKARLQEWLSFQSRQQQALAAVASLQASLRQAEENLTAIKLRSLGELAASKDGGGRGPSGTGYLSLGVRQAPDLGAIRAGLDEIGAITANLPDAFRQDPVSPYARLLKEQSRLGRACDSTKPPALEEIVAFRETISRTLTRYLENLAAREKKGLELRQSLEELLEDVLLWRQLAEEPGEQESLDALWRQILTLAALEQPKVGQLELLAGRFQEIKQDVVQREAQRAYRTAVSESLTRNLGEMGYRAVQGFSQPEKVGDCLAQFAMPEGEVVRLGLMADNRLAFELLHKTKGGQKPLNAEELAFFKGQEAKWCQDFLELMRRLAREGFQYNIKLEREVPAEGINLAVLETAEDLLAEEDWEAEERERLRDELQQRRME